MLKRNFIKMMAAVGFTTLAATGGSTMAAETTLTWQHFPAGEHGFFRAPVLVSGDKEAILIDGGFTYPDGKNLVDSIKASGKKLTTIYVSQSDPDYYFSLTPVKAAFPDVKVIAASETVEAIKDNVAKKLETWGPQLKENGPQTLADVVIPEVFDGTKLTLEGQNIDIVSADGLSNRRYLWVPSLKAVFGGVMVFSGTHVWTADTATAEARAAWVKNLNSIIERKPEVVIAGHIANAAPTDVQAVIYTRDYLLAFEEELAKVKNSDELIAAMTKRYPQAGMGIALQIGAKVALGEMQWG